LRFHHHPVAGFDDIADDVTLSRKHLAFLGTTQPRHNDRQVIHSTRRPDAVGQFVKMHIRMQQGPHRPVVKPRDRLDVFSDDLGIRSHATSARTAFYPILLEHYSSFV
jgi:hypothetical protein